LSAQSYILRQPGHALYHHKINVHREAILQRTSQAVHEAIRLTAMYRTLATCASGMHQGIRQEEMTQIGLYQEDCSFVSSAWSESHCKARDDSNVFSSFMRRRLGEQDGKGWD
jgi:hypothetical protein